MLRNLRHSLVVLLALALVLAAAACGGGSGEGDDGQEGVPFAVYADEAIGDRADDGWLRCGAPRDACPPSFLRPTGSYTYRPTGEPALGPEHTAGASAADAGELWAVTIELTGAGAQRFHQLTRRLAQEGKEQGRFRNFAVVVGDEIVAYTTVHPEEYPDGIQTTSLSLAANDAEDAQRIVETVNAEVEARSG